MEKIKIQFTPLLQDYGKSARILLVNRQKRTAIVNGFVVFTIIAVIANFFLNSGDSINKYSLPILIFLAIILFSPIVSAWLMQRKASKQPQLLQTVVYEMDNEQILSVSQLAESKLNWNIFNKVFEADEYYFLIYVVNKSMYQFIPKRAFESPEQEKYARILFERKLGRIENIQKGLRGWKLSLLTFLGIVIFSGGCLILVLLLESFS
ncbi:MAG TPA: YcxB family protein [Anaerolineales bacterium]|nr:YcxB family protein [Anaerolineales bacterium]